MSTPASDMAEGMETLVMDEHDRGETPVLSKTAERCMPVAVLDIFHYSPWIGEVDNLVMGRSPAQRQRSVA